MLSFSEAIGEIMPYAQSFGKELVTLDDSLGRTLAETVMADRDYPPFDRSAMDGIAIRYSDLENGFREFTVIATIYAGIECRITLAPGQCYKIMTGAAVPAFATAVIRNEDLSFDGNHVSVRTLSVKRFQNIASRGQDLTRDEVVLKPSVIITPALTGLLAALGKAMVWVEKLPSVSLFTTGNEVVGVEKEPSGVEIRNSNGPMMKALLRQCGIRPYSCEHIRDDIAALTEAFHNRLSADILVISGGVSAGDEDFVPLVLGNLGFTTIFHKVAIKPGKPIWCGKMKNGPMVFALPGNPFACMVTFKLFVEAFIRLSYGQELPADDRMPLAAGHFKKTRFDEFFPVKILGNPLEVKPAGSNGSGDVRLGMGAEAFALHAAEEENLAPGTKVSVYVV